MTFPGAIHPNLNYFKDENGFRVAKSTDLLVDGGITLNHALYDAGLNLPENSTIGFYFVSATEKIELENEGSPPLPKRQIKTAFDYSKALAATSTFTQQFIAHKHSTNPTRTVHIDHLGIDTMQLNISIEQRNTLIQSGWDNTISRLGIPNKIGQCPNEILLE